MPLPIGLLPALKALPWRWIAAAAAVGVVWWQIAAYGGRREDEGRAAVTSLWEADTEARNKATAAAIAAAQAREDAAKANNFEVLEDANAQLLAIAADRDSLAGRMRDYENSLRRFAAAQATDQRGLDVAAGIASRAAEADRLYNLYDASCRRDAVRFQALQDQVRPQL